MPTTRAAALLAALLAAPIAPALAQSGATPEFTVRKGYTVEVALEHLNGARFIQLDDAGHLYVSRPRQGDIIALAPEPDGTYRQLGQFVDGRSLVHGMQFFDGWLYFASDGKIERAQDADHDGEADRVETVLEGLPEGGGHWWRPVLVTDSHIYTSIGDGSNASDQTDTERQKMWRFNRDGSGKTLFASGIRNTEKLMLRPGSDEVWGFDHGSDWFGREAGDTDGSQPITNLNPPDELNHYEMGKFYGHPFVVGMRLPRYEYLGRDDIHDLAANTTPPEWQMGAHWACNGWTFIDPAINEATGGFPADHAGDIVVAAHGSWNSSVRVGYCVARVMFDKDPMNEGHPVGMVVLVSCLGPGGEVLGRPVDVIQHPDGSLLFSVDNPQGRVYRLRSTGE
jgi:glucose/arabinose dehydrogenase